MKTKLLKVSLITLVLVLFALPYSFLNFPQNQTQAKDIENLKFPLKTSFPGRIQGKGKYFEIKDSKYLNVSLFSEKEIEVSLESIPRMISLILSSSTEATTTTLTLKGFQPNKKYYKYEDSYKNATEFFTDQNGSYSWQQDLTKLHHVWFQERKSTIFLPEDCPKYGIWNPETNTCTLTQDLPEEVEIKSNNVTLDCSGHKISGNKEFGIIGVYLNRKKEVVIKNCNIINSSVGIYLFDSTLNEISKNNLFGNLEAIYFAFSSQNAIKENNIFQNDESGIYLDDSQNNEIKNNKIYQGNNGICVSQYFTQYSGNNVIVGNGIFRNYSGVLLFCSPNNYLRENLIRENKENFGVGCSFTATGECGFEQDIDTSNTVDGKPIYYLVGQKDKVIDKSSNAGYVAVVNSENIVIKDLTLKNNYQGILLVNTENSKIENVVATDNRSGIELIYSSHNRIIKNLLSKNGFGIFLNSCSYNEISENEIEENHFSGVYLFEPSLSGSYNLIFKNNISKNSAGISLDGVSNETIKENNISENGTGLEISYSNNNLIYHNNFINNETQAENFFEEYGENSGEYGENSFDNGYPEGGNYWSDYDTPEEGCDDKDKDGFCDNPYTFDGGRDNYPFVKQNGWLLTKNQPPIPIINFSPKNPVKGVKVKFDASSSTDPDPDGKIQGFFWEIKKGEEILATSTTTTTNFAFPENGQYQIILTATDNDNATSSTSTIIKVEPFSFAIITDLHIGRGYPDYDGEGFDDGYNGEEYYLTQRLRNVVKWINENKEKYSFKFVAVLGDIADTAEKSEFCKAKEILDELEIPYVPIFGNHDVWPYTEKESAPSPLGEDFFERIFWSTPSIPCENASSTRNFETLLKEFNFERDTQNPKFKNFIFNYGGINFIGLDFNSREKACEKECGVKGKGATHPETINWLKNRLANFSKDTPIILFSHHPITKSGWEIRQGRLIYVSAFSPEELEELKNLLQNYNIQFVLSGHVHGFEKFGKEAVKFSPLDIFFTANWLYSSFPNIPVLTTEALMVGSNENDEVLEKSEFDKGIVRVVKIFDSNNLNFEETAAKYSPRSGEGKEFVALNPYISWAYKFLENSSNPCIFLKSHPFTNRDISSFEWDLGNGEKRYGKVIPLYCYSATGTYTITSTVTDAKTGWKEWITRKIEIKEGLFSKIIKIKDEIKEKTEIISQKIGENLLEFGNYLIKGKDRILLKIKHSPSIPLADLIIDFDEATGDIDLSQMIFDSNLKEKKSILYMPTWPKVVKEKILLLPK